MQIPVISKGDIPEDFANKLVDRLNKRFGKIRFIFRGNEDVPDNAFSSFRDQYKAERILDELRGRGPIIAITDVDIYSGDLNYVFGETEYRGPAIVSINRLRPEFYNEEADHDLLIDRLTKEVIHEVGHCFGLDHCENDGCVMNYSNSINTVDNKGENFCEECQINISTEGLKID